jgi:hypothetical protein
MSGSYINITYMHFGLWLIVLNSAKMPPKIRSVNRANRTSTMEQTTRERVPRMSPPNVNENVGVGQVEEVSTNQIFGKIIEILQIMIERRGT